MKNEQKNDNLSINFTKELYLKISADKASKIVSTKQERDDIISKIAGRIEYLKELKSALKEVRIKIKNEKKLLRRDKNKKFALSRELLAQKAYNKSLDRAYTNGEETIDLRRFYSTEEQKTR